jgi:hypothetical protein
MLCRFAGGFQARICTGVVRQGAARSVSGCVGPQHSPRPALAWRALGGGHSFCCAGRQRLRHHLERMCRPGLAAQGARHDPRQEARPYPAARGTKPMQEPSLLHSDSTVRCSSWTQQLMHQLRAGELGRQLGTYLQPSTHEGSGVQ